MVVETAGSSYPKVNQVAKPINRQLWRCHYPFYYRDLLPLLPAEVAIVKGDEEGTEASAQNERATGKDEGLETERPPHEGTANGAASTDEGRKLPRRLFAFDYSDAVHVCDVSRDLDLAGFSAGKLSMDPRSLCSGTVSDSYLADLDDRHDGCAATCDTRAVG